MQCKTTIKDYLNCPSRPADEWQVQDADIMESIKHAGKVICCEPGQTLYSQGDPGKGLYCIRSGLIGLRRVAANGNSVLIRLASAGSTIGYRIFLTLQTHANSAEVLKPSEVYYIPKHRVEMQMKSNPLLREHFLQHLIRDAIELENDYVRSMTMDMKSRFLHVMLALHERYGYRDAKGNETVDLPLKRGELAELVGVRPESISRLIDKLQSEKVMSFRDRQVQFGDIGRVLQEAGVTV
jgi:CRP-like cAMP-binding protein